VIESIRAERRNGGERAGWQQPLDRICQRIADDRARQLDEMRARTSVENTWGFIDVVLAPRRNHLDTLATLCWSRRHRPAARTDDE